MTSQLDRDARTRGRMTALIGHRVLVERTLDSAIRRDEMTTPVTIPLRVEGIVESWHLGSNGAGFVNVRGFGDVSIDDVIDLGPWEYR